MLKGELKLATIASTLKMFDAMSRPLQSITQGMNMMISTMHQMQNAAEIDIRNSIEQATRAQDKFNQAAQTGSRYTNGLLSNVKSMAAAYLSFQTARAIGESTIVAAMNQQQTLDTFSARAGSETLGAAIYDRIAKQALSMGQDVDASLAGTMSFMSNTMDPGNLAGLNKLAMRLSKLNPTEGLEGAAFSLKELMSGDYTSIAERFNMSRTMLQNSIARKAGLEGDVEGFIAGMDNLLNQQKMTEEAFEKMLDSPAAKWQSAINTFKFNMANAGQSSVIALTPLFDMMNQMFEDGRMQTFFNGLNTALVGLAKGALWLANVGVGIQRNWEMIAPAIWSIIGALIIYNGNSLISMANTAKDIILKIAHAAASSAETIAIIGLTIAQEGFNAAIALCPITWIIGAIIILISVFYLAVAAINHFAGTSLSATGLIAGASEIFHRGGLLLCSS